ncbi:pentatricopeptide repeat-containing protein At2g45350, chloroplastic [Curcuma longa]|uniref:pentatricopeptide repeat-containing protein At2g45350, chloroplastic n=1 Tax=Curcuma longa TaxID=136217 RepID=UPI003D9EF108
MPLFLSCSQSPPDAAAAALDFLPRCRTPRDARHLHARLVTSGLLLHRPAPLLRRLFYSLHPPLRHLARRLFFSLPFTDHRRFLWNALIGSSSRGSHPREALLAFALMLFDGVAADEFAFSLALTACSRISRLLEGSQIHGLLLKSGLASNPYLQNGLIAFYSKCGLPHIARKVFDRVLERDAVAWNSMIDGYVKEAKISAAEELFDEMDSGRKNVVTWNTMLSGYTASVRNIDAARQLFDSMPERDMISWNLMIDGYVKCGRLVDAEDMFEKMPERDVISCATMINGYMGLGRIDSAEKLFEAMAEKDLITWNTMMDGYVKNGLSREALNLFAKMHGKGNAAPDNTTLATVLKALTELGRINDGISIHEYIKRSNLSMDGNLGVALIDMYSKCGRLDDALKVFDISANSVDHWNAMISGFACHGRGDLALKLFQEMERRLLKPDVITFIAVLSACSHAGMVDEGLMCFEKMQREHGLEPKVQHYGCMVDILSRAGKLEEALGLIRSMPMEPNDVVWRSLLSACRNHRDLDMGQKLVRCLTEESIWNSSSYVLLSNLYAGVGLWGDAWKLRMLMREKSMRKLPGCSWIEVDGNVYEFVVGDQLQTQAQGVNSSLNVSCIPRLYSSTAAIDCACL